MYSKGFVSRLCKRVSYRVVRIPELNLSVAWKPDTKPALFMPIFHEPWMSPVTQKRPTWMIAAKKFQTVTYKRKVLVCCCMDEGIPSDRCRSPSLTIE